MLYMLIKPILFLLPPEVAHHVALFALRIAACFSVTKKIHRLDNSCVVMGIRFPNRVGLAAGFDKNGDYIHALGQLGFGFLELGTATPRPQPGNPKPRLFRLPAQRAIINRMGFNNKGIEHLVQEVARLKDTLIIGINIGKNYDTPLNEAINDYMIGLKKSYLYADYVTINISSPNTPGLTSLQAADTLTALLSTLKQEQQRLTLLHDKYVPLVVKVSPDLSDEALIEAANIFLTQHIDGVIATNTTLSRAGVEGEEYADETGGLSGAPLIQRATEVVKLLHGVLQDKIPIIAVGGICSVADGRAKLAAGASLLQLYTGLIYEGPRLIRDLAKISWPLESEPKSEPNVEESVTYENTSL